MSDVAEPTGKPHRPSAFTRLKAALGLGKAGMNARKTVTFGDASAVTGSRFWSVVSVITLIFLWYLSTRFEWTSPIFWPSMTAVKDQLFTLTQDGYRNFLLWEHVGWSVFRVFAGLFFGCLVGIPLGFAMGLNNFVRAWFDPIVEFMRPVPPLALIPLVILWFGIEEVSKIVLLFLAALWIMVIAARSGVSGVRLSKVHAAYSLGASKWQVLRNVILPNALPEIFIGIRVALGVCWGTVVAAELVAAERGIGMVIATAQTFFSTDIVVLGIIIIGIIGYVIDILMRMLEDRLVPWKGKG